MKWGHFFVSIGKYFKRAIVHYRSCLTWEIRRRKEVKKKKGKEEVVRIIIVLKMLQTHNYTLFHKIAYNACVCIKRTSIVEKTKRQKGKKKHRFVFLFWTQMRFTAQIQPNMYTPPSLQHTHTRTRTLTKKKKRFVHIPIQFTYSDYFRFFFVVILPTCILFAYMNTDVMT